MKGRALVGTASHVTCPDSICVNVLMDMEAEPRGAEGGRTTPSQQQQGAWKAGVETRLKGSPIQWLWASPPSSASQRCGLLTWWCAWSTLICTNVFRGSSCLQSAPDMWLLLAVARACEKSQGMPGLLVDIAQSPCIVGLQSPALQTMPTRVHFLTLLRVAWNTLWSVGPQNTCTDTSSFFAGFFLSDNALNVSWSA